MPDIIIGGSTCQALAKEISDELQVELGSLSVKRFPDGEIYLRVESDVKGKSCVVVQSTCRPQDSTFFELLSLIVTLKELGAKEVKTVVPYYGYGRQDKSFNPGEAVTARVAAKHISMHSDEFYTLNIHEEGILKFFNIPVHSLDASPVLGEYFKGYNLEKPIVIGPDNGASRLAKGTASVIKCKFDTLEKRRIAPGEVQTEAKKLAVADKDVILVDDMIDYGSTMLEAISILKAQKAGNILVGCVHPVLTGNVVGRLFSFGAIDVIATNTISSQISFITVSGIIAEALR
ncbi:MAG: ribose-phosphate diphosphokinase [Candidatus Hydrothermarchaeales archaeon]